MGKRNRKNMLGLACVASVSVWFLLCSPHSSCRAIYVYSAFKPCSLLKTTRNACYAGYVGPCLYEPGQLGNSPSQDDVFIWTAVEPSWRKFATFNKALFLFFLDISQMFGALQCYVCKVHEKVQCGPHGQEKWAMTPPSRDEVFINYMCMIYLLCRS